MQREAPAGNGRAALLGPFLAAHWRLPIAQQGEAPPHWPALERSLAPVDCGSCHPKQLAEWRDTFHARAYSPGLAGQLREGALAAPASLRGCQGCHAPLAEQQPVTASGAPNPSYAPELRDEGIVCAGCHVRGQRRLGPPRRVELPPSEGPLPHGGFEARSEYQESRFCAECHQFFDDEGVAGKPIQNTYVEWQQSPAAAEGKSCQSCHMPDRAHLWRGIHDPEMVRSGTETTLVVDAAPPGRVRARLTLASHGVGHAFPTYVTPRVFLELWQEDAGGASLDGTSRNAVVGRQIDFASSPWREVFDTRIPPGGEHVLRYDADRHPDAVAIGARVRVDPDYHYRGVFASLEGAYRDAGANARIAQAYRLTRSSPYVLSTRRRSLAP
jgi:hypothetical protein